MDPKTEIFAENTINKVALILRNDACQITVNENSEQILHDR